MNQVSKAMLPVTRFFLRRKVVRRTSPPSTTGSTFSLAGEDGEQRGKLGVELGLNAFRAQRALLQADYRETLGKIGVGGSGGTANGGEDAGGGSHQDRVEPGAGGIEIHVGRVEPRETGSEEHTSELQSLRQL